MPRCKAPTSERGGHGPLAVGTSSPCSVGVCCGAAQANEEETPQMGVLRQPPNAPS